MRYRGYAVFKLYQKEEGQYGKSTGMGEQI